MMIGRVSELSTYPVKSLSGQPLDGVRLDAGRGFPDDRRYGFARHDNPFDPAEPEPFPKARFLTLMRDERLASVRTHLDGDGVTFHLDMGEGPSTFDLSQPDDQARVTKLIADRLGLSEDEMPRLVSSDIHRFTDVSVVSEEMMHTVSILNRASLDEICRRAGLELDPVRFRANMVVDGWPPFLESELMDRVLTIGQAELTVVMETKRCAATAVNPVSAERDINVVELLRTHAGRPVLGIYARVDRSGDVAVGDSVVARID